MSMSWGIEDNIAVPAAAAGIKRRPISGGKGRFVQLAQNSRSVIWGSGGFGAS